MRPGGEQRRREIGGAHAAAVLEARQRPRPSARPSGPATPSASRARPFDGSSAIMRSATPKASSIAPSARKATEAALPQLRIVRIRHQRLAHEGRRRGGVAGEARDVAGEELPRASRGADLVPPSRAGWPRAAHPGARARQERRGEAARRARRARTSREKSEQGQRLRCRTPPRRKRGRTGSSMIRDQWTVRARGEQGGMRSRGSHPPAASYARAIVQRTRLPGLSAGPSARRGVDRAAGSTPSDLRLGAAFAALAEGRRL